MQDPAPFLNTALFLRMVFEIAAIVLVGVVVFDRFDALWQRLLYTIAPMTIVSFVLLGVTARTLGRKHADEVAPAFEAAETALFDEDSAPVRLAGFVFLCRFGATSEERSDQVWPLLDEAIQCYHGDPEYRDMLVALLTFVQGAASAATKAALAERLKFDAENGASYVKSFSAQIIQACE